MISRNNLGRGRAETPCGKRGAGCTLLELIIALIVLGLVAIVLAPVVTAGVSAFVDARQHADRERQATLALERFVRDMRFADGDTIATQAGETELSFVSARNGERYTYRMNDGRLTVQRGDGGGATVLARGVSPPGGGLPVFRTGDTPVRFATLHMGVNGIGSTYQATGAPR